MRDELLQLHIIFTYMNIETLKQLLHDNPNKTYKELARICPI
ncbi:hypothetical protein REIP_0654 [Rickettsia endosymbiont of Ixodes pacificus]|nr:hypothetical protein [Rickettsia endosymbiont of Ixodes pacificus]KJW02642.1 hypothetical protein REIP_0654 [Rickettsia endosymbiont of Ixodes pacificus]